ncbi:hypothetical protein ABIE52_000003 [Rhodococcus sp. OAS809]|uniref:Qat anti-phage system associated protein QatB n=1 Tax=Rhodococcus sp. OAS809 TaxID=2663874 RepID=UPI001789C758
MGTSQSSSGPGSSVSLVPPWADDAQSQVESLDGDSSAAEEHPAQLPPAPLAPPRRFRDARRSLGRFAGTGARRDLERALAHYVSQGYGGSSTMARRLGATSANAARLNQVLSSGIQPDGTALRDETLATGSNADVVMDAIVEAVRPVDGTQDSEASRKAMRDALSDLLDRYPTADLLTLNDMQRQFVIERYAALDVYGRFCLDLQKSLMHKAPDAATALNRLKQIRAFITEHVAASFRSIREKGLPATTHSLSRLTKEALRETLGVFEEYLR